LAKVFTIFVTVVAGDDTLAVVAAPESALSSQTKVRELSGVASHMVI
jgi:hypothetical protein